MEKTFSPIDMIQHELCSRYNLRPDQVNFEIRITDVDRELALVIADEYKKAPVYKGDNNAYIGEKCISVHGNDFDMWVHFNDETLD